MDNLSNGKNETRDVEKGNHIEVFKSNPIIVKAKPEKESPIMKCVVSIGLCSMVLLVIALIVGSVAYYVYSIMALVENSNDSIKKECKKSNMWAYLLTVIIVNLVVLNNSKPKKDEGTVIITSIISLIITISLCTWGSIEYWNDCVQDNLSNTLIFKMIEITIYMQYSVLFIFMMIIVYTCKKLCGEVESTIERS